MINICHSRVLTDCLYSVCISRDISQISSQPRVFWLITLRLKSRHHMRAWNDKVLIIVIVIVLTRSLAHNLVEGKWQLWGEKLHFIASNKKLPPVAQLGVLLNSSNQGFIMKYLFLLLSINPIYVYKNIINGYHVWALFYLIELIVLLWNGLTWTLYCLLDRD